MNIQRILILSAVCLAVAVNALAQQQVKRPIHGKVKPERLIRDCNNETIGWSNILVKIKGDGQPIQPYPQRSMGESWSQEVNVGTDVRVAFFRACYGSARLQPYKVTADESQAMADAVMYPDYCPPCPKPKTQKSSRSRQAYPPAGGPMLGGARVSGGGMASAVGDPAVQQQEPEPVEPETAGKASPEKPLEKMSPEKLLTRLKNDAATALEFDSLDVFQYNFEAAVVTMGSDPALKKVLDDFRKDEQNAGLFEATGNRRPEVFRKIVEQQFGTTETIDFPLISKVISDPSIDPSIRGSAVVAMLDSDITPSQEDELRKMLRPNLNTSSNELYLNSVIALARLGDPIDNRRLVADFTGPDVQRAVAALTALRVTQMTKGGKVFRWAISAVENEARTSNQPAVRLAAIQALRPSIYYRRLNTSIQTLADILVNDDNEHVRAEAAIALGLGRLERRCDVRALLVAARQDDSALVQTAADTSLKGNVGGIQLQAAGCSRRTWMASRR